MEIILDHVVQHEQSYKINVERKIRLIVFYAFHGLTKHYLMLSRCQFHQHFMYKFFVRTSFFYVHVTRKSCQNATFVRKICTFHFDEIDYRQTFISTYFTFEVVQSEDTL